MFAVSHLKPIITAKNGPTEYWGLLIWQIIGCLNMFATTARYIFEIDNFVTYIFNLLSNCANIIESIVSHYRANDISKYFVWNIEYTFKKFL